ncbi:MAG TPA: glycosyltransferase [Verrucomicrobiae bacterium]|nr:glycosyltransferase [Verrucomicrobiae bacterium]
MISFIVPAHNEEAWIGRCLSAIRHTLETVGHQYEIIVVDDSSTDATSSDAQRCGAQVIRVNHRHISAARNAGAREARGDIFFFVDADTLIGPSIVRSAMDHLRSGAVGGGCIPRFDGRLPLWWRSAYPLFVLGVRVLRQPGGSCLFCTRAAFEAVGGFSEAHYAAEDAVFVTALKRQGLFVIPADGVVTSGRNLRNHSFWSVARLLLRLALRGPDGFRDRRGLDFWYKPSREKTP